MYPGAVSAPHIQSVPIGPIYAKFTLTFPLFAFSAVFLLPAVNLAMRFFILVIFLFHFLSILRKYRQTRLTAESQGLNSLLNHRLIL